MAFLKESVDYFRDNGFEILIWIGETMGHHFDNPVRFHRRVRGDLGNCKVRYGYFAICVICIN